MPRVTALCLILVAGFGTARADDDGFVPMFNGKDLTGWVNVNCAPGTFFVKDNMIITTGIPTGYLRTTRQYENFIAEFEWFHAPPRKGAVGNSGFFVWADPIPAVGTGYTRGIEVQVLVNLEKKDYYTSQGDLFSIWGATCKPDRPHPHGWERCLPSENRQKGEFEWNHFRVEANNGVIKLAVNGKVVSGISACKPRKGYLALESEGSECRFKNLKIKELPSTNPKPSECADVDKGFKSLLTGIDFTGWQATEVNVDLKGRRATQETKAHWKINDGVLISDGKVTRLETEKTFGDFEFVFDWRARSGKDGIGGFVTLRASKNEPQEHGFLHQLKSTDKSGSWNRYVMRVKGEKITVHLNGKKVKDQTESPRNASGPIALEPSFGQQSEFRNIFIRELKGDE